MLKFTVLSSIINTYIFIISYIQENKKISGKQENLSFTI